MILIKETITLTRLLKKSRENFLIFFYNRRCFFLFNVGAHGGYKRCFLVISAIRFYRNKIVQTYFHEKKLTFFNFDCTTPSRYELKKQIQNTVYTVVGVGTYLNSFKFTKI